MEFVCDEILLQIFSYCKDYRQPIRLTCKRFYELMCEIDKNWFPMKIKNYMLQDEKTYGSIVNSRRVFKEMELDSFRIDSLDQFWKLKTICYFKAANITKFSWISAKMTSADIIGILNLFPSLKELNCSHWKLQTQYYNETCEVLSIPLETLNIKSCDDATIEFFTIFLPPNILKSLSMEVYCPTLLSNQKSLKKLKLKADELGCDWIPLSLEHLDLTLRKYKVNDLPILDSILKQQPDLVYLDILNCNGIFDGNDEAFITLCSLKHLKVLKMNIDDLNHDVFKEHFEKLKKLEELWMESIEHNYSSLVDIIEELSKTKMEYLTSLWMEVLYIGVPENRIEKFGKNFLKLEKFHLCCEHPLPLVTYLKSLKSLKSLEVSYHYGQEFSIACNNVEDECFCNIKEIKLRGFNFGSDINSNETSYLKLINALPNLTVLEIDINLPLSIRFLPRLLARVPALKSLKGLNLVQQGNNYEKFGIDFVNYYIMLSKNLEMLALELKLKAIDMDVMQMKSMLSETFIFNMSKTGYSALTITLSKKL